MTKELIQRFINQDDWVGLTKFIKENDISRNDLEAFYMYHYYAQSGTNYESLLSIATFNDNIDLVETLLSKNVALKPKKGQDFLELFFKQFIQFEDIEVRYDKIDDVKLQILKSILSYAAKNEIKIGIDKIVRKPVKVLGMFTESDAVQNNSYSSYLQIFCSGMDLDATKEDDIFDIVDLLVKNGADIYYKNNNGQNAIQCIKEPKVLQKLLEIAPYDYLVATLDLIKADANNSSRNRLIINSTGINTKEILQNYLTEKFYRKETIGAFANEVIKGNMASPILGTSFVDMLSKKDIINLSQTSRAINNATRTGRGKELFHSHTEIVKKENLSITAPCRII